MGAVNTMSLSGGHIASETLARYGTRTVFALAGAGHTHLLDALDRKGFRIVSARHETGAISAADGYARVTGRIGIALTITDQGLPNAITGLACAYHACSPVVVLMARLPDAWIEPEAEHDSLSLALLRPVTKWCRTVPSAARLAEYIDVACRRALAGRPGPVVLQVPQEFFAQGFAESAGNLRPRPEIAVAHPDPAAIARAADLIVSARRPLVITGAGATRGEPRPRCAPPARNSDCRSSATASGAASLRRTGRGDSAGRWRRSLRMKPMSCWSSGHD